jgi:hypothetical protein
VAAGVGVIIVFGLLIALLVSVFTPGFREKRV